MLEFSTVIKKFSSHGEKTGWTYIEIPAAVAQKLKPGNKRSFRVVVTLDECRFQGLALLPMGDGKFILALNAGMRKKIRKEKGAMVKVVIAPDSQPVKLNSDFLECLADEPDGFAYFNQLTPGHRKYFSNWIDSAKTDATKTKRIAQALIALSNRQDFGQMVRSITNENKKLKG